MNITKGEFMIRIDRLKELRDFTLNESPKIFDFSTWNSKNSIWKTALGIRCGTNGCLLGNAPLVWPNEWEYGMEMGSDNKKCKWAPNLKSNRGVNSVLASGVEWFGISMAQAEHIFQVNKQVSMFGNTPHIVLKGDASLQDVITVLDRFIAWAESTQEPSLKDQIEELITQG